MNVKDWGAWLGTVCLVAVAAKGDEVDFRRDVWPILQTRCVACHGPEKQKSSLRVDSQAALLKGGDSGPAIIAGQPDKSYLIELVSAGEGELRMPPEDEPLTRAQIGVLKQWILGGAKWAEGIGRAAVAEKHWAFQPVTKPAVPAINIPSFASDNPIDAFIAAKLAERGLEMSRPADPHTFIRRVTLDLTGLPPTLVEVEAFVSACASSPATAYQALVERLLASPRYGER